jgi:membrane glycosyltransferase
VPWSLALSRHRWHALAGVALALVAWGISWQLLAWLTPAVVGMVLSAPLSKLTASPAAGRWVQRLGLLGTPEETEPPAIGRAVEAVLPAYREAVARAPRLEELVRAPTLLDRHLALTDRALPRPRGHVSPLEAVVEKKIREAHDLDEALALLGPEERARVLALPALLRLLVRRVDGDERANLADVPRPGSLPEG